MLAALGGAQPTVSEEFLKEKKENVTGQSTELSTSGNNHVTIKYVLVILNNFI